MYGRLIAAAVAGALATGCTFLLPVIENGGQRAPREGEVAPKHQRMTAIAVATGLIVDLWVISLGVDAASQRDD